MKTKHTKQNKKQFLHIPLLPLTHLQYEITLNTTLNHEHLYKVTKTGMKN